MKLRKPNGRPATCRAVAPQERREKAGASFFSSRLGVLLFFLLSLPSLPAHAAVFHPETYTLANGLRLVIVPGALSDAAVQMVWYKIGSLDDPRGKSGLAHYLEHLMFKGTPLVPEGAFSATIAAQGGNDNAFTGYDSTAYYVAIAADRLPMIMQMEADRMRHLSLTPAKAKPELDVVLSERDERTDNDPHGLFQEKLRAALFADSPYGRPVIGWREELATLTAEDAENAYKKFYAPNNAIVVISGQVNVKDVLRLATGTFGRLPRGEPVVQVTPRLTEKAKPKRLEMKDSRVTQAYFLRQIVAPSFLENAKKAHALEVLATALDDGEVGLLYKKFVRQTRQASAISVAYDPITRGPALFGIAAVPAPGVAVRTLEKDMTAFLKALAHKGLTDKEVAAAKKRLEAAAVFARDSLMAPAQTLGDALAVGQTIDSVETWPSAIHAVSTQDVNRALRALLQTPRQIMGLLEPEERETGL